MGTLPIFPLLILSYIMQAISYITRKPPLITPDLISLIGDAEDVSRQEKRKSFEDLNYKSASLDQAVDDCAEWMGL